MAGFDSHPVLAYSTVATAPSPATTGTSITVGTSQGARFTVPPFQVTVWPVATVPTLANAEILRCTAVTGDVLTVTRAQEGTTARTIVVGDQIAATITPKVLTDIEAPVAQVYSVKTFGAKGDGVTDDTTAINATILAMPTTGSTLYFPAGMYLISAAISLGSKWAHVLGAGAGVSIIRQKAAANLSGSLFNAASASWLTFEHITIDGNKLSNSNAAGVIALYCNACTDVTVRSCEFSNTYGPTTGSQPVIQFGGVGERLTIDGNYIHDGGTVGTNPADGLYVSASRARIVNNVVVNCTDTGIVLEAIGTLAVDSVIANNVVINTPQGIAVDAAITTTSGGRIAVTGNTVDGCNNTTGGSIYIFKSTGVAQSVVSVVGNTVANAANGHGIYLSSVSKVSVVGNIVDAISPTHQLYGILVNLSDQISVVGNVVQGCGGHGISVQGSSYVALSGNVCKSNGTFAAVSAGINVADQAGTQGFGVSVQGGICIGNPYGIILNDTASNVTFQGVDVRGSVTAATSTTTNTGTGNRILDCPGYNPVGTTTVAPGASPYTYTAGNTREAIYITGGTVSAVSLNGITVTTTSPATVQLEPHQPVVITYSVLPTVAIDRH